MRTSSKYSPPPRHVTTLSLLLNQFRPSQSIPQLEKSPASRDEPVSGCRDNIRMGCRWSGGVTLNPFMDCWCFICYAQCHKLLILKSFQKPLFINNRCYATVPGGLDRFINVAWWRI
ncbi:hypothetical protein T12_7470 [Trichinella patagoniensis]|uniref:Uncharacterized protein n=1 Tax=Trichinella patagoniensis TaxID=990121 RepID=A0A0V0Z587_9BILA|nr:hypothetical protein T12_7470 [Trichinella patagoniensis]